MTRTPEQAAADEAIEAAIKLASAAYQRADHRDQALPIHWLIVAHSATFDGDGEPTEYTNVYHSPGCLLPTALGLLALASDYLSVDVEDEEAEE